MGDTDRRIMAVVLTHNAPDSLDRCLRAIAGQTLTPDSVLVVDNASRPPVSLDESMNSKLPIGVVRSEVNTGPAGGYAQALAKFLASGIPARLGARRRHGAGRPLPRATVDGGPTGP